MPRLILSHLLLLEVAVDSKLVEVEVRLEDHLD